MEMEMFCLQAVPCPSAPGPPGTREGQQAQWLQTGLPEAKGLASRLSSAPCSCVTVGVSSPSRSLSFHTYKRGAEASSGT